MKNSKKFVICAIGAVMGLTGCCGGGGENENKVLTVCLASEPQSLDPALNSAVDGATMLVHLDSGLYRYVPDGNGGSKLELDLAKSITKAKQAVVNKEADGDGWKDVTYNDGVRYTVTLKDGIKWSNGNPITADDFIWSWNRASGSTLAADYCYMFEAIANGVAHESDDAAVPSLGIAKVSDSVFTIDLPVDITYFDQLLAFPTYFPVNKATVEANDGETAGAWATEANTYVSCGAYTLSEWVHDSYITLKANPNYWDAENVTMKEIKFALSDDAESMLASYNADEYQLIDDVPPDQIAALKQKSDFHVDGQMGTYYISYNINSATFNAVATTEEARAKVRQALGLFVNRVDIVDNVAQGGQVPANAFVSSGLTAPDGKEFIATNGVNRDGKGYFDAGNTDAAYKANVEKGIAMLKEVGYSYDEANHKFTNFPAFTFLYNTSASHEAIAKNIKDTLAYYGITVNLENQEWNTFLETRKEGGYDVARNGWVADYNDPSTFLTLWTTVSGNNDCQFGKGAHAQFAGYSADVNRDGTKETGLTWAESYDVLVDLSNKEADPAKRFAILHEIEDLLMETGCVCPIYYYTDLYMAKDNLKGFFSTPLGYKFFHYSTLE